MAGKKKRRAENTEAADQDNSESSDKSDSTMPLKRDINKTMREFHRTQRRLTSLVESGEITTGNSTDAIESLEDLIEHMHGLTESLCEEVSDQGEKEELWQELEQVEKESRETIRLTNKAIREKINPQPANAPSSTDASTSGTQANKGVRRTQMDWTTHGLRSPQLPVFSGEDYENWKITFDAFVGDEDIPEKFKMIQLKACLGGDPLKLVSRYNPTAAGYTKARSELERKYGGTGRRIRRQLEEIRAMKPVRAGNCKDLDDLADCVQNLVTNLEDSGCVADLTEMSAYYILVKEKLPASYLKTYKRWQQDGNRTDSLILFADWLADEAVCEREAQEISLAGQQRPEGRGKAETVPKKPRRVFSTETVGQPERRATCLYCNEPHSLDNCPHFTQWTVSSRYHYCKTNRICFRCLSGHHLGRNCRQFNGCSVNSCEGTHHTLLHATAKPATTGREGAMGGRSVPHEAEVAGAEYVPSTHTQRSSKQSFRTKKSSGDAQSNPDRVAFQTVPVKLSANGRSVIVSALLDPCSDASYLTEAAANELQLQGEDEDVDLETVNGSSQVRMKKTQIQLSSVDEGYKAKLSAFVIKDLSSASTKIDWNLIKDRWDHMKKIPFPNVSRKGGIDMLIGLTGDTMSLFLPEETVQGPPGDPVAVKTPLGWAAFGPVRGAEMESIKTLRTHIRSKLKVENQEEIKAMREMTELEVIGVREQKEKILSVEDKEAMKKVEKMKHEGGRYEVNVPWRNDEPNLSGNFGYALSRLRKTEENMKKRKDEAMEKKYGEIFEDYVKKGYFLKIAAGDENWTAATCEGWFLPHFPVIRQDRATTKIRLVFDAAAKYQGRSLNDELYPGPSICSDLIEILLGFRRHPIALTGDVEEMFLQVKLATADKKYHRVLWRDGEAERAPDIYEAQRWIFGNAAAPFAAQYVMKENAKIHAAEFPLAAQAVERSFYMDDALCSFKTEEEAKEAREQLTDVMKQAGMHIRKWRSSSSDVAASIPEKERAKEPEYKIEDGPNQTSKTLGLLWNADEDTLGICASTSSDAAPENRPTKRLCLKKIAAVFDPLCLICPLTITAKIIFQETWARGLDWDDPLPPDMEAEWLTWLEDIQEVSSLTVPRCVHSFSSENAQQLHVFSDASEQAYAAVIYVVTDCEEGIVSRIALARARVTPRSRKVTIPRLELMAALLGLRLVKKVCAAFEIQLTDVVFWSDSLNVICWIKNDVKRFQPFVAHRVSEIREFTSPDQWRHIPGTENPADLPSRGAKLEDLKHISLWWEGPPFLLESPENWPKQRDISEQACDPSEFRKEKVTTHSARAKKMDTDFRLQPARYSKWMKLIRVTAWVLRFVKRLKQRRTEAESENLDSSCGSLSSEELTQAEYFWFLKAQECFEDERRHLQAQEEDNDVVHSRHVCKDSKIRRLCPVLDNNGLVRVGGRLQQSGLSFDAKHPVLLPKHHDVTKLFVRYVHEDGDHELGIEHTVSELRQRVWIIGARERVKKCIWSCPECVKRRRLPRSQLMAPKRTSEVKGPYRAFLRCAVDFAGPFETKQGRCKSRTKRYLCLFLCQQTRAVHLEVAFGLDTDSFLRAFMRFVARRGVPAEMTADNGKNFIGASRELQKLASSLDQGDITTRTAHLRVKWNFTPPGAPHFNGGCEAMVKSAKRALRKTLESAHLSDEELQTAFCRAEALLNSRPLTSVSSDPNDQPPISPASLMLGQTRLDFMPDDDGDAETTRRRWRRLLQLSSEFWRRWIREYLPTLQGRQKWTEQAENLREGELVLLVDPNAPRGLWPLARVTKTFPGPDGLVRVVEVKTAKGVYKRPVTKTVRLELDV